MARSAESYRAARRNAYRAAGILSSWRHDGYAGRRDRRDQLKHMSQFRPLPKRAPVAEAAQ